MTRPLDRFDSREPKHETPSCESCGYPAAFLYLMEHNQEMWCEDCREEYKAMKREQESEGER